MTIKITMDDVDQDGTNLWTVWISIGKVRWDGDGESLKAFLQSDAILRRKEAGFDLSDTEWELLFAAGMPRAQVAAV